MTELYDAIFKGNLALAKTSAQAAIDQGGSAQSIIDDNMVPAMEAIGKEFEQGRAFVPNLLLSARAMKGALEVLKPLMLQENTSTLGTVVIGTVKGDLHDIGKNLVKMMMEGKGLEVIDLGTDVEPEVFIKTAKEQGCKIICCSALLTTTMGVMADVVKAAEEAGIRDSVKIMVGGAPVTDAFCAQIGADAFTVDAATAAEKALEFCTAV